MFTVGMFRVYSVFMSSVDSHQTVYFYIIICRPAIFLFINQTRFNLYYSLGLFSRRQIDDILKFGDFYPRPNRFGGCTDQLNIRPSEDTSLVAP